MSHRALSISASLLLGAALAACAHNPEPRSADTSPVDSTSQPSSGAWAQEIVLSGRVVNSGTEHLTITTLQVENSAPTRLVGALQTELRTLAGAEVRVSGVIDSAGSGRSLDVREYDILSINGQRPHVGTVLVRGASSWLVSSDTLRLIPELDALREREGARVWVIGAVDPGRSELRVESFGVIAPAP